MWGGLSNYFQEISLEGIRPNRKKLVILHLLRWQHAMLQRDFYVFNIM